MKRIVPIFHIGSRNREATDTRIIMVQGAELIAGDLLLGVAVNPNGDLKIEDTLVLASEVSAGIAHMASVLNDIALVRSGGDPGKLQKETDVLYGETNVKNRRNYFLHGVLKLRKNIASQSQ